jgi:cellulose biosynthesis protein BcsQ
VNILIDNRLRIFTGHFGSGKTEVSINYAIELSKQKKNTCIVDLDIVNPYFSVREVRPHLESMGIKVISPSIEITTAELSTVPAEVLTAFNNKSYDVVLDIGGDDIGSVVLGQYNRFLIQEPYDMYFVVNTNRPLTSDVNGIIEYINSIERASRLKVSYLINNTNMSYETKVQDIITGQNIIKEVSQKLNIPVRFTCVREDLADKLPAGLSGEIFKLNIFMRPVWLE